MRLWLTLVFLAGSAAAQADTTSTPDMKCAAYLQAEAASGWSEGVTGQTAADANQQQSNALHDYCHGHPDATVAEARQSLGHP